MCKALVCAFVRALAQSARTTPVIFSDDVSDKADVDVAVAGTLK